MIDRFIDEMWLARGLAANSLNAYRRDLNALANWLAPRGLTSATAEDLFGYLSHRQRAGYNARSTARSLSCLRNFYRWLVDRGELRPRGVGNRAGRGRVIAIGNNPSPG